MSWLSFGSKQFGPSKLLPQTNFLAESDHSKKIFGLDVFAILLKKLRKKQETSWKFLKRALVKKLRRIWKKDGEKLRRKNGKILKKEEGKNTKN